MDSYLDEDTQIDHLKAKVDAGADFIVTQLFYDADQFLSWYRKLRAKGIHSCDHLVSQNSTVRKASPFLFSLESCQSKRSLRL